MPRRPTEKGAPGADASDAPQARRGDPVTVAAVGPEGGEGLTESRRAADALGRAEAEALDLHQEVALLGQVATLGVLAGSLAHELNQPLMSIQANAEAALRFLDRPEPQLTEALSALSDIARDNRRAADMIRRLLEPLKKGGFDHRPLDVNLMVTDVVRLLRRQMDESAVAIELHLTPRLPRALGDRIQLQQVMLNLLLNACEAVKDVDPCRHRVIVRSERAADGLLVSVSDHGIGLAAEEIPRIFEPFYTTKPHGMGLGLAICRTIVTLHGGRLRAEPSADAGTTFSFTLKIANVGATQRAATTGT